MLEQKNKVDIKGEKPKLGWNLKDVFSMSVRPLRVTASHARQMVQNAGRSAETFNPMDRRFWTRDNYKRDEMIKTFDKYCQASSSALALGISAGIGVVGSPVLGAAVYDKVLKKEEKAVKEGSPKFIGPVRPKHG